MSKINNYIYINYINYINNYIKIRPAVQPKLNIVWVNYVNYLYTIAEHWMNVQQTIHYTSTPKTTLCGFIRRREEACLW